MHELDSGVLVFDNGLADLPTAASTLFEREPPAIVVRGLADYAVGRSTHKMGMQDVVGPGSKEYLDATKNQVQSYWQDTDYPYIIGWKKDRTRIERAAGSAPRVDGTLGPHFDVLDIWDTYGDAIERPAVMGLSVQTAGTVPSTWYARGYSFDQAIELYGQGLPVPADYRDYMPSFEQHTGDGVIFLQKSRPTLHGLDIVPATGRQATILHLTATRHPELVFVT